MNPARANSILANQSSMAKKVFSVVPMQEYWSIQSIMLELRRLSLTTAPQGEVAGCLRSLVDAGLVSEIGSMQFRSVVKPTQETDTVAKELPKAAEPAKKATLLDRLANKAEELRSIANELDDLAIEFTETLNAHVGDAAKLRELQQTLRGLLG